MVRILLASAALAATIVPAAAGGDCGGDCYRRAWQPAEYGAVVERYPARAPRTSALVTPAEYRTVRETVMTRPAGRVWTVTRDHRGREVGCWVETPARYASVARRVMMRAPEVVPYAQSAAMGYRTHHVVVQPAGYGWEPIGRDGW